MSTPIDLDSVVPCPWCSTPTTVIVEERPYDECGSAFEYRKPADGECLLIQYPGDGDGGPWAISGPWWLWWCHCGMESDEPTGFNGQPLPTYRHLYPELCAELEILRSTIDAWSASRRASQDF